MAKGDIQLDGREYLLKSVMSHRRYPVNQMAPKIGQGQSEYRDLTSWDAWITENWQDGVGQRAESEGLLYAEADTRVPRQIILPPLLQIADTFSPTLAATDLRHMPGSVSGEIEVGSAATQRISIYIDATAGYTLTAAWFLLRTEENVTASLYAVDANKLPTGAALATAPVVPVDVDKGFRWYKAALSYTLSGEYAIVLSTSQTGITFDVAYGTSYTGAVTGIDDGAGWSTTGIYPFFFTDVHKLAGAVADSCRFNGSTYLAAGAQLYKWDSVNSQWGTVGAARPTTISDLEPWDTSLYVGLGDSTNYQTMSTAEAFTSAAEAGRLFFGGGGYLWKAVNAAVKYMGAGGSFSAAINCGPPQYKVRGIAELDGDVYVTNDEGLLRVAAGDRAVAANRFGGSDSTNGVDLTSHMGSLYMTAGGQVLQASSGAVRNIWMRRQDEFPYWVSGRVVSISAMSAWPVVLVTADSADGFDSVWAWQETGWHHLALLPQGLTGTAVRYDRNMGYLIIGTSEGLTFRIKVSSYLINPYYDGDSSFQPYAWFETDWFSGGLLEADKDIESLYLRCRNLSATRCIEVYWQEDDSEEEVILADIYGDYIGEGSDYVGQTETHWSYLGTFTENRQEIRWELGQNRPNTREIRLGFLVKSAEVGSSPRIEAYRLKYHMMTMDWYGWDLPIQVSGTADVPQQMLDGEPNPYTSAEQIAHLDSLVKSVPPFLFTDIDGTEYEVKVRNASFSPEQREYYAGSVHYFGVYTLQLEATHDG